MRSSVTYDLDLNIKWCQRGLQYICTLFPCQGQGQRSIARSLPDKVVKTSPVRTKCLHFLSIDTMWENEHLSPIAKPVTTLSSAESVKVLCFCHSYKTVGCIFLTKQLLLVTICKVFSVKEIAYFYFPWNQTIFFVIQCYFVYQWIIMPHLLVTLNSHKIEDKCNI